MFSLDFIEIFVCFVTFISHNNDNNMNALFLFCFCTLNKYNIDTHDKKPINTRSQVKY